MTPKHSNLGPSSAERWFNCPGSIAAIAAMPGKSVPSVHAAEGTVAHELCEEFVTGKLTLKALRGKIGRVTSQDGFEIEITEEMIDAVVEYRDTIQADIEALRKEHPVVEITGHAEVRVYASSVSPDLFGTADYILVVPGAKLVVYDFKYGKGVVVDAERNKQMLIYALAAMDTLAGKDFKSFELVIVQPRAGGTRRWTLDWSTMTEFSVDLKDAVAYTQRPDAHLEAGSWCRWCPAQPLCPEAFKGAQERAMVEFAAPPAPKLPEFGTLPLEMLTEALEHEEYVIAWFGAVRAHLKMRLEGGLDVPGYKLVEGRSNRKFVDDLKVIEEFEDLIGLDALLEPRKLISPAKLEKIVGKGKIDHLTFKPEAGKSIAKDSDPRPAVKNSAEVDFGPAPAPAPAPVGLTTDDLLAELAPKKIWPV